MAPRPSGSFLLMTIGCRPLRNGLSITLVSKPHFWKDHRTHVAAKAPEYALDEVLSTASDMYSLGCLIYAVHLKGDPPFKNFGNLSSVREHAGRPLSGIGRLDRDLQGICLFGLLYVCVVQNSRCSNARLNGYPASAEQADTRFTSVASLLFFFTNLDSKFFGPIYFCG